MLGQAVAMRREFVAVEVLLDVEEENDVLDDANFKGVTNHVLGTTVTDVPVLSF